MAIKVDCLVFGAGRQYGWTVTPGVNRSSRHGPELWNPEESIEDVPLNVKAETTWPAM